MADTYKLKVTNNSSMPGKFVVYQKQPDIFQQGAFPLAWFAKGANKGTVASFRWEVDYSFIWSEVEKVAPGVICNASEIRDAGLRQQNKITLDKNSNGYIFTNQTTDAKHAGSLLIEETGLLPPNGAAVGIGMSGSGTFVWPAQPNVNITVTPHPEYWIAFGSYEEQEILDVQQMTDAQRLSYPINTYSATLTLQGDNTWSAVKYS